MNVASERRIAAAVLLFGPQTPGIREDYIRDLKAALCDITDMIWIRELIKELPTLAQIFCNRIGTLKSSDAPERLRNLEACLVSDKSSLALDALPNVVLTPLVVIGHLVQYIRYLEILSSVSNSQQDCLDEQVAQEATLGFCTGIFSALAVSCSPDKASLKKYGAAAIRLATLVGALVDAEEKYGPHGDSRSFSAAWTTADHGKVMETALKESPEAYLSVRYDENRATITAPSRSSDRLQKRLKEAGLFTQDIGLRGRFHDPHFSDQFEELITLCDEMQELQLPNASDIAVPSYVCPPGHLIGNEKLHVLALRQMLLEPCEWRYIFEQAMMETSLRNNKSPLLSFGTDKCIPPTFLSRVNEQLVYMNDWEGAKSRLSNTLNAKSPDLDNSIAIVGMSCKVAGADDLEEMWDLMCRAESQHAEVPEERFTFDTQWREKNPGRKWFGNFIRDHDAFDHKFFKKSPREATSQDPQQRLFLQSAYQAVEQSGYFNSNKLETRVGVFVGVCAADYEANVACYAPNAFTATGNLKSFIAGKISHYFGWSGPGLTIDTACSASAVAIHQACRAILGGECVAALAGGTTVMTSPLWFQNLAGASFLSPTGACKPFDSKADGYCRGEAVASVFLKKTSQAIKDGDPIIGCIRSSAVYQNDNCTPIFVPNAPSLSTLFEDVVLKAGLQPSDISLVEAHGTGTPVGDPAEYESIRNVFGGRSVRSTPMPIGSVKGLVGHTECASGVIALIKVLLLLKHKAIPPQASFKSLSPGLRASPDDMLEVVTQLTPWKTNHYAALINNYGASGSNASIIVGEAPCPHLDTAPAAKLDEGTHPFWIPAFDDRSLQANCLRLRQFIQSSQSRDEELSIANLSYNVAKQSNRNLPVGLIFQCSSIEELNNKLQSLADKKLQDEIIPKKEARPVILCFGGQISQQVDLDQQIYESSRLLRKHLDICNSIIESLGLSSIYPAIFERRPVGDPVKLQTMLFALQYSTAMCWIDCGIQVSAVTGHSFGELTAMCVSGRLSLNDSLRVVAERAKLIKEKWGPDPGAMMAVAADIKDVHKLLEQAAAKCPSEQPVTIACFNGPRSFTLAGSTTAMDIVESFVSEMPQVRSKRLAVANAFHSTLVEPLFEGLESVAKGMTFRKPAYRWERATEEEASPMITPRFFATHMREPVFANHAFQRLNKEFPSAIWLEAGSNSTITEMASKALGSPGSSHFQAINLGTASARGALTDAIMTLWKEGLKIPHWSHHALEASSNSLILLPPYQFEKSRHWLELKKPQKPVEQLEMQPHAQAEQLPTELFTFVGYQDKRQRQARFRINTMIQKYANLVMGHKIAETAHICPATVELGLAIDALLSLRPDAGKTGTQPEVLNVENQSPLCVNPSRYVWLDFAAVGDDLQSWKWEISSTDGAEAATMLHVKGQIKFRSAKDEKLSMEFDRYKRLVGHQRCLDVLNCPNPDDVILGRNMYKVFAEIVDYSSEYHGLEKLVGKDLFSAGIVKKTHSTGTWLDPHLADCFSQVGGFWVNCMTDRPASDMYIAAGFESWVRAPTSTSPISNGSTKTSVWHVIACHHEVSDKAYTTDIFIFDAADGSLCEVILGVKYARVSKSAMRKVLVRLTATDATQEGATISPPAATKSAVPPVPMTGSEAILSDHTSSSPAKEVAQSSVPTSREDSVKTEADTEPKVLQTVLEILAELTGLEVAKMKSHSKLADIGIDSLMGMEMAHELEGAFKCTLDMDILSEALIIQDVVSCVALALGGSAPHSTDTSDDADDNASDPKNSSSRSLSDCEESMTSLSDNDAGLPEKDESDELQLSPHVVLETFGEVKLQSDQFISDYNCANYLDKINPRQTELCVVLTLEAFEELGSSIKTTQPGETLARIQHAPQHDRLVRYLYEMLETDARLIDLDQGSIIRTSVSAPTKSSDQLLEALVAAYPDHTIAGRLAYFCGKRLPEVLNGTLDGVKVIFGTDEGRDLVSKLYGDTQLNKLSYKEMSMFIEKLVSRIPPSSGPLKILEMGAGTGGTTKYLVPLLAKLNAPVEYTFTDLAPSFVAMARKKYKDYPFMKFRAHDIEKEPAEDLIGSQHLVVASNAIHATHSLAASTKNIRKALRSDGVLMMLEMTETLRWVDIIFGLLEGWWLFDDDRPHALSHQSYWEDTLHSVGYGHVDWTDGHLPENRIQRVIIAMASGSKHDRLPVAEKPVSGQSQDEPEKRESTVTEYVAKYTKGFAAPQRKGLHSGENSTGRSILVTGATGSLGSHLVAKFAMMPDVATVICLNRPTRGSEPLTRQRKAFTDRKIIINAKDFSKLLVLESDTTKSHLGLSSKNYDKAVQSISHIVHNAWPMSGNRPIRGFEAQFQTMRNLVDLASDIVMRTSRPVGFQFISSIAVVGHYPLHTATALVPEASMDIESVLPNGYGEAKLACERILEATLARHPEQFRTMSVRLGQVAGSSETGYWNALEHLCFLIKSSQTLRTLPDFGGVLSWTPVNLVAATLSDLVLREGSPPEPIYHIDNPVRQPWKAMISLLADSLRIPHDNIVPFADWVQRVRTFSGSVERDNPAYKLVDFLDGNFVRMSCGGLLLDTMKAQTHSSTLASVGPVNNDVVLRYLQYWREIGFLSP